MNSERLYCYWLFFSWCYLKGTVGLSLKLIEKEEKRGNNPVKMIFIQSSTLSNIETNYKVDVEHIPEIRVKRDAGAGKFVEAAQMPQIKLVRLFLQMFKNTWDPAYIGGTHPFHPALPKTVVKLFREKIVEFFLPDVGQESKAK